MLNMRLYHQEHHFPSPPPLCHRIPAQLSLGASCLVFAAAPEPHSLVPCYAGHTGMAAPCPELHPCVPVSWQAQLPAPARAGLWSYSGISPAVPVHLLQSAPEITRPHLSHCFYHESGQNFSSPPVNTLENHLWSMPLLQIPFLSPWYRKGRPETWLQSWRGCLLCL